MKVFTYFMKVLIFENLSTAFNRLILVCLFMKNEMKISRVEPNSRVGWASPIQQLTVFGLKYNIDV